MDSLRQYALGEPLSKSPHAVACSLPTLADVCGYEENDPSVLAAIQIGYPRFVVHPYVRELTNFFLEREMLSGRFGVLVTGLNSVQDLLKYAGPTTIAVELEEGLQLVHCSVGDSELAEKIRKYIQHVGCGISSRRAEAFLVKLGRLPDVYEETLFTRDAAAEVVEQLAKLNDCAPSDVWICASGMSAFYTGFRAAQSVQRGRGRTDWLQLGWLYLDSGCVLKTFLEGKEALEHCYDVNDTEALIERISSLGGSLAAVIVECPTNPLIQICDLKRVSEAVRAAGGVLMVDPTVASIYNMDVLPYADVLVTSLTKYAAYQGDVMIGALALNAHSPCYEALKALVPKFHVPPYRKDLRRLAYEMQDAAKVVAQINSNAARLADFLRAHPAVTAVHYATGSPHHTELARSAQSGGGMISIELAGSMESFYDKIAVMKGPSFGTETTLLSPFMYLAHYDLVVEEKGRAFLKEVGVSPELIRISVGVEPYEEIEAAFAEALDFCLLEYGS